MTSAPPWSFSGLAEATTYQLGFSIQLRNLRYIFYIATFQKCVTVLSQSCTLVLSVLLLVEMWYDQPTEGEAPAPCSQCSLTRIDKNTAALYGGSQLENNCVPGHVHLLDVRNWVSLLLCQTCSYRHTVKQYTSKGVPLTR